MALCASYPTNDEKLYSNIYSVHNSKTTCGKEDVQVEVGDEDVGRSAPTEMQLFGSELRVTPTCGMEHKMRECRKDNGQSDGDARFVSSNLGFRLQTETSHTCVSFPDWPGD